MKQAVFFDIDGTIWNDRMEIPKSAIRAIRQLRENGHYAFLCSGRSRANIGSEKLLDIGFDGVVAACGTHIDFHKETVFEKLLTAEQILHGLKVVEKHGMEAILEGPKALYAHPEDFSDDPFVVCLREELGEKMEKIGSDIAEKQINKMSVNIYDGDITAVTEELGGEFDVIVHEGGLVAEIMPHGFSKAVGIRKVCEILHISLEDTYAFGDSENDLDMLDIVAHGIAMGNASRNAKQAAEFVTSDIEEDGIMNGLLHYGLI